MKRISNIFLILTMLLSVGVLQAQMTGLHGDATYHRNGLHAGNQFRTTFYNDGTFGQIDAPPDIGGEWPTGSQHVYLVDGNVFVMSEVIDTNGDLKHISSEVESCNIQYSRGDQGPNGEWWTFLPLPGFYNQAQDRVAMTKWTDSWPAVWPDIADPSDSRYSADGWAGSWNGYFGRDQFNADEESYFVADDYANQEFSFYPDSTDSLRRGLGIRMYVRGFQWSNALVEDAMFVLYDLENIGTHAHDKMAFGYKVGNDLGNTLWGSTSDTGDDCGAYDTELDVAYMWDDNNLGVGGWTPVGYFGAAFLESPGNAYDGIDNDDDGKDGPGASFISEAMFNQRTLVAGENVVVIDYKTFERSVIPMPTDTLEIQYQDLTFKFWPGKVVEETMHNLVDDNLNGIIDENNGATFGSEGSEVTTYLYTGLKYIDYLTGDGLTNPMIEERRDDGIDNNENWDVTKDDLGRDGKSYTFDEGEGDGMPTAGEPHFDQTDIGETDMVGLTSFKLYLWADIPLYDDELVWDACVPGLLDDVSQAMNVELFYGSGYFPMQPGQKQRFSVGIICGADLDDFFENTRWVKKAYDENYNFALAPTVPTVTAVAGDNRVTLYWDSSAEGFYDPITGYDFEGYRIYRSTDVGWNDMTAITDGMGSTTYRKPLAQFDLDNDYAGYAKTAIKGVQFWNGDNTGLVHSYVDSTAVNGYTYYYAVCAYDHGSDSLGVAPTECKKFISINSDGSVEKSDNVVIVRPEAPAAGYVAAESSAIVEHSGGTTDGYITVNMVYPDSIRDGHTYQITFNDTLLGSGRKLYPATLNYSLTDITSGETLIANSTDFAEGSEQPEVHGFNLSFFNVISQLALNTDSSAWNRTGVYPISAREYSYTKGDLELVPGDFAIIIGELGIANSTEFQRDVLLPSIPVNFKVWNMSLNREMKFAFREQDANTGEEGIFSAYTSGKKTKRDEIIILSDSLVGSWEVYLSSSTTDTLAPQIGDTAFVVTENPFLSNDIFEFTMSAPNIDETAAKSDLDDIRVVPNPYVVANSWEPQNTFSNGRGERQLHFINLPVRCTIRIFTVRGQLVDTIEHDSASLADGTEIWDMQTKDNLDISYGIYIYHIDAGKLGSKIGKFAVIK